MTDPLYNAQRFIKPKQLDSATRQGISRDTTGVSVVILSSIGYRN